MATPIAVAIPPLGESQTIKSWQPFFLAAVSTLIGTEGGEKAAIRLLPAYVKRGKLEERTVLKVLELDTITAAFDYLKERLDPERDVFAAAERFRAMTWPPGEFATDFLVRYIDEALQAELTPKQACVFFVTQMPHEIQGKLKEWIRTQDAEWSEDNAMKMAGEIKRALSLKDIPLDKGFRGSPTGRVARVDSSRKDSEGGSQESEDERATDAERSKERSWNRGRTNFEEEREVNIVQSTRVKPSRGRVTSSRGQEIVCYGCGKPGHLIRNCPERRQSSSHRAGGHYPTKWNQGREYRKEWHGRDKERVYQVTMGESAVTVQVNIGGKRLAAMLDTGASPCVMDCDTAKRTRLLERMVPSRTDVYGLCNNPVPVLGYVDAEIFLERGESTVQRIQILQTEEPTLLLGRRFMQKLGSVQFDFERGRIKLGKYWTDIESTVEGATPLARAQVIKQDEELDESIKRDTEELLNPELEARQKERVAALIEQYQNVFSRNRKRPTRTKLDVSHAIITSDSPPQSTRPRRVPPSWEKEINLQLKEMMNADPPICRPSNSPWSSDVVLVKKKDGSLRFAVDYRRLNSVTKRDEYSLPNPQSIFDKLEGSRYFTKLDIASAYWTVPIRKQDTEKTAFHTPRGLFEMLVMPFGLCNSQSTFQRLMDRALRKVPNTESYVDDILVFSDSFEEHLIHLRGVFQCLDTAGLQLRKDKCRLAYRGVEFLGHWISEKGRSPLQNYTKKVQNFSRPETIKELQRYLGLANYYRSYIKDFSLVAEPLYALTRIGSKWCWDERCEQAFDELRHRLLREPVTLRYPRWDREFHIEADACASGVGAVLGQMDEKTGKVRPIEYFSSSLSPSQRNYSAGQLEAWAAIAAIRKWTVYLKGAIGVVLHTDHCPLKWILSQKDPKPTFTRWLMELQGMPLRIETRAGRNNTVADCLSRKPHREIDETVNTEDDFEEKVYYISAREALQKRIEKKQSEDDVISNALAQLQRDGEVSMGQLKRSQDQLKVVNGILLFQDRVVVPQQLRLEVLEAVHAQHHLGTNGTLQSLRKSYFWIKMARDTRIFCRGCLTCQRAKPTNTGKEPIQEMKISNGTPGYAVGIDVGTLPWAEGGYRYFLLMVDLFTRYIELYPLTDQEARSLVKAFEQGWIYRGHGVPVKILSDQGSSIDGEKFREFCHSLGVEKKRTTPYHPETDGMAERNIGMVKQVIRCLQLDRSLPKGSWPSLLTEVSFHCNGMENTTSRTSPHMLTHGHQPKSPMDAWCETLREGEANSHQEYLSSLKLKQETLQKIAQENINRNLDTMRRSRNKGRTSSRIQVGDRVMLKRNNLQDSLAARFDGPYSVLGRKGPSVKLRLRRRDKWVHLNHCKIYIGNEPTVIPIGRRNEHEDVHGHPSDEEYTVSGDAPHNSFEQDVTPGEETDGMGDESHIEEVDQAEPSLGGYEPATNGQHRRYPTRERKKPAYFSDYANWDEISEDATT